jgi:multidrug efflux pump subunit AcrA (membrane-fusion protein)
MAFNIKIHFMKYVLFSIVLAIALTACGKKETPTQIATAKQDSIAAKVMIGQVLGIAIIEPAERITKIASQQGGIVREIKVKVGESVKAGQIILVLDNAVEQAQLRQADSKIATQNDVVEAARQNLQLLQVKLDKAKSDLARNQSLLQGNALTPKEVDDSRYQVTDLEQQLKAQEAVIKQQQTRLGEIRADIGYYQTVNDQKVVRAPKGGTLLSLDAKIGEFLDNKGSIGDFAPAGPVIALTEIDELYADRVKVGQKASIRPQGGKDILATGTVVLTSPYLRKKSLFSDKAEDLEDRRVREVRVQLDQADKVLFGARVECLITVE